MKQVNITFTLLRTCAFFNLDLWMACQSVPHSLLTFDRFLSNETIPLFELDLRPHLQTLAESFELFQFDYYLAFGRT